MAFAAALYRSGIDAGASNALLKLQQKYELQAIIRVLPPADGSGVIGKETDLFG
jgi:hypothetical protein